MLHYVDNKELLDYFLTSYDAVLVFFNAKWCGSCKTMMPVIEQVATHYQYSLEVCIVDVDQGFETAMKYCEDGLPCTYLSIKQKYQRLLTGYIQKQDLINWIEKHLHDGQ